MTNPWVQHPDEIRCPSCRGATLSAATGWEEPSCGECGTTRLATIPLSEFYGRDLNNAHYWVKTK